MNWKKTGIKVIVAFAIAIALTKVGVALDVKLTNELALQQMQNTSTTLLTNQGFNKTMTLMDVVMIFIFGVILLPEVKYIIDDLKRGHKK